MKKVIAPIVGAITAAVVIAATSLAAGDGPSEAALDRLFGGGRFTFPTVGGGQAVREFSVDAQGPGNGTGSGTHIYGSPDSQTSAPVDSVTCVRVDGNRAVIAEHREGSSPFVRYFIDHGTPGPGADEVTARLIIFDPEALGFPARFPDVCPAATPPESFGDVFQTLTGDISVVDR
jgi:hypothetical protein